MTQRPIRKLFIANRGEIARRIAEGAKALGIGSAAVVGRAVPPAFLAGYVDQFIHVPEERTATYLDQDLMIRLALESGCDAVHPGFGFLSENAGFAAKVIAAGLTWVGPGPAAIEAMASKATARDWAVKAGVPCLPGLQGVDLVRSQADLARVQAFARETGYPLLIKAAMGGGGKGMRLVHKESELVENATRASSEALSAFGDGSIIVEKYLPAPRHVEVQVLADAHGHVYAIGDRDCSLQRRHQKVLEEAPAPGLDPDVRARMHAAAVALAKNVGYVSAGTVEFLLEERPGPGGTTAQSFYFLEMNTRLQVEHPVTEEVFGLDLVQWQLRIAQGEALRLEPKDLAPRGHSIEVRLYAEDVAGNFFPSPGPVLAFRPHRTSHTRWEVGLDAMDRITPFFDPMVAKLIVRGADRADAFRHLREALEGTLYVGPAANLEFLRQLSLRPAFVARAMSTHYLQDELPGLLAELQESRARVAGLAERLLDAVADRARGATRVPGVPAIPTLTAAAFQAKTALGSTPDVAWLAEESLANAALPEAETRVGQGVVRDGAAWRSFHWAETRHGGQHQRHVMIEGHTFSRGVGGRRERERGGAGHHANEVRSPVPGKVIKILAEAGRAAAKGEVLMILESMKMEFEVQAPRAGTVAAVKVTPGTQVDADAVLVEWAEDA